MEVQHDKLQRGYRDGIRQRLQSKLSALAMKKSTVAQIIIDDCREDAFLASPTTCSFAIKKDDQPSCEAQKTVAQDAKEVINQAESQVGTTFIVEKSEKAKSAAFVVIAVIQMVVILLLVWYLIKSR